MDLSDILLDEHEDFEYTDVYAGDHPILAINFLLKDTPGLIKLADSIRADNHYLPLRKTEGWYNWYVTASTDSIWLEFTVVNTGSDDDESIYGVELSQDEAVEIRKEINKQCQIIYGDSIEGLIMKGELW